MAKDIKDRHRELKELEKNIKRKQTLLEIIAKEIEDEKIKIAEEWEKLSAVGAGDEVTGNCTEETVQLEHVEERGKRVSGLKVMGVFTLCGVLLTLGRERCDWHTGRHI